MVKKKAGRKNPFLQYTSNIITKPRETGSQNCHKLLKKLNKIPWYSYKHEQIFQHHLDIIVCKL